MTETTGSEQTPDQAQATSHPDHHNPPPHAEPSTDAGEVAVAAPTPPPTPVDPAELPATTREVPAARLIDPPGPGPDDDEQAASGSSDPAAVSRGGQLPEPELPPAVGDLVVAEPVEDEPRTPAPTSWDELALPDSLRSAIDALGWTKPTPVQGRSFATMIAGTDVLVQSQTGSGKTGAFCLPWLASRFQPGSAKQTGVQLIVLLPTRELAKQVCDELVRLATDTPVAVLPVYGGTAMAPQLDALAAGVHAVVGTPGRILDHIRRRSLDLSKVNTVVLDECDEMLSMGFLEDIRAILSACPRERQTCLFSATVPREIERIARRHMREPVRITLSGDEIAAAEIEHAYYSTGGSIKTRDLLDVVMLEDPSSAIVFCNTREETRLVANVLIKHGYSAAALSSDLTQAAREHVMGKFRDRELRFLVATDVAARGIDVSHVSHVINYSFPENAEVYVHRTGRTGRAGRAGTALSIISPLEIGSFYTLTKTYKGIHFSERKLPAKDELAAVRTEVKLDRISRDYSEPVSPEWLLLARRLTEDPRGERVVAYLLHEAVEGERFAKRQAEAEAASEAEPGAEADTMEPYGRDRGERRGRDRDRRGRDRDRDRGGRDRGRDRDRGGRDRDRDPGRDRDPSRDRDPGRDRDRGPSEGEPRRRRTRREDAPRDELAMVAAEVGEASDAQLEPTPTEPAEPVQLDARTADAALTDTEATATDDADADTDGEPGEQPRKRRRRRRRRGRGPAGDEASGADLGEAEAEDELTADRAHENLDGHDEADAEDLDNDAELDDGEVEGDADADGEDKPNKKRRRRRRRRGRGPSAAAGAAPAEVAEAEEPASAEPGKKKRRRRRRRGKGQDDEGEGEAEADSETEAELPPIEEAPRVSQDEIIIDIDEQELVMVRDEFGEIDELDELTLKGRRRAVLEDLTEEMEVEDLSYVDADEDESDDESDDDDDDAPSPGDLGAADAGSTADAEAADGDEGDGDAAGDSGAKKKRRRRRRKKKAPPPMPELSCPPHKDFWEVWAAKFSAADFQRDEDLGDMDEVVEDEPAVVAAAPEPELEPDGEFPLIEDVPDEDALVRVSLNIGRHHGHKAAHVRSLLKRVTGLHGKAVKDLTVRDRNSLFRMDVRHFETVVARLDGRVVDEVALTLIQLSELDGLDGDELPALRVPEPVHVGSDDAEPTPAEVVEPVPESPPSVVAADVVQDTVVAAPEEA